MDRMLTTAPPALAYHILALAPRECLPKFPPRPGLSRDTVSALNTTGWPTTQQAEQQIDPISTNSDGPLASWVAKLE
jgi:hypothetical protein